MPVTKVSPATLSEMLKQKQVYLVDVRERSEYRREHIAQATLNPLKLLNPDLVLKESGKTGAVCVMCASGGRSATGAQILADAMAKSNGAYGDIKIYDLAGGMSAWRNNHLPVIEDTKAPLPIIRQVHLIASTLIITGALLSRFYSSKFIILPIFVGCGLFVSGATGFCGMATILQRLPYNRDA